MEMLQKIINVQYNLERKIFKNEQVTSKNIKAVVSTVNDRTHSD